MTDVPLDRRTFLKVAGLSAVGTLLADRVFAQAIEAPALAPDPIVVLANELDFDPERIFRFVSDEVRYEPYTGVLRGARGTLAARAGNSADRSLLLSALLAASGVASRFAIGRLERESVDAIMGAASLPAAAVLEQSDAVIAAAADAIRGLVPPEPDEATRAAIERAAGSAPAIEQEIGRRLSEEHRRLVDVLSDAGIPVPEGVSAMPETESTSHVWLQAASGAGWLDLDPILPGQASGMRLADVASTSDALDEIPRHLVTFRVIGESVSAGQLRIDTLLEHTMSADQLVGQGVAFAMERPEGLKGIGVDIAGVLTGSVQYTPMLVVGDDLVLPAGLVRFGGGEDIFGPTTDGGPADGESTALWLEVLVESPERPPRTAKRTIFDRIGESHREAGGVDLARIEPIELIDLDGSAQPEYLPGRTIYLMSVASTWSVATELIGSTTEPPFGYDTLAAWYHWVRESIGAGWAAPLGARPFCDGPNVAAVVLTPGVAGGELTVAIAFDLLSRSFGALGVDGAVPPDGPGILAGVASHIAERTLMGDTGVEAGPSASSPAVSVGRLFEEADRQGIALTVLDASSPEPDFDHPAGPQAASSISRALRDGHVVVVPERPVLLDGTMRLGWWVVDPATGAAWDELDTGGGAVLAEWAEAAWRWWRASPLWFRLGVCASVAGSLAASIFVIQASSVSGLTKGVSAYAGGALGVPIGAACGP